MAQKKMKRGIFITLEGVEGCGKSTHARLLCHYIKHSLRYPCIHIAEPGSTEVGDMIRRLLLETKGISPSGLTELFLFEASRAELVSKIIHPALKKGYIVLCDRFYDATLAYQGYGSGLDRKMVSGINLFAAGNLKPDLTIVLDIDAEEGLRRAARGGEKDRMEEKPIAYHRRVRKGYKAIAKAEPGRVRLIATREEQTATQELLRREVDRVVQRYTASG